MNLFILNNPAHVARLGEDKELLEGARELVKMLHRAVTEGEE